MESMITIASVGIFVVALAALIWSQRQMGAVLRSFKENQPHDTPSSPRASLEEVKYLNDRADAIDRRIEALTLAVADGIDHVQRNEKRVRGIVLGAKRRFEASDYYDPGVDAEADTLPQRDEESGRDEGVLPLQPDVESPPDWAGTPWAAVPGIDRA